MPENENGSYPQNAEDTFNEIDSKLDEIEKSLHNMLLLAELSASDLEMDRETMQKTLEHLKDKIDHIADELS